MISGSGRCSACGGVEFHIIPINEKTGNPSGPARWECERCGRIRNNYDEILVPGHRVIEDMETAKKKDVESSRLTPEQMGRYETVTFHPSVKACSERKCSWLVKKEQSGVNRKVCGLNDRIPGNMLECPLDAAAREEEKEEEPAGGTMYNSISSYNTRRDITVTRFNDGIATAGRCDRGDYQEIISSIVKAARLNGYQIPEE